MLDSLPGELLRAVFAYVSSIKAVGTGLSFSQVQNKSHLLKLSQVSRKFRFLVFPRLFEVLTVKSYDEDLLWDFESHLCFAQDTISRVPKVLTAVRELRFSAPFESRDLVGLEDMKRCPHSFTQESSASSIDSLGSEDDSYISHEDASAVMRKQEIRSTWKTLSMVNTETTN